MNLDTFLTENPQALTKLSLETLQTLWQEHRQRLHQALYANEGDRTILQAFWTWLDQEVGDSPAGRATVIGQFLKIKDCRALGQRIDPNLERWNTPKLDLIDNSYEDYIDYAWQHSTLEALHAQHRDRCAPKPINPYPIQNQPTANELHSALTQTQLQGLQIYYQHCERFLQSAEPHSVLHAQIRAELITPLQNSK